LLPVKLPSPWTNFWPKYYFSGSAWSESMWLLPFPKTQIPPQRSSFRNCGQHPKCRERQAKGTSRKKTSSIATVIGSNVSASVWPPKGTTLKWIMLIDR
jgi:hypothetical protein